MKVLVTGSNGLLGQSLRKVLGNGHVYHTRKDVDLTNYEETFKFFEDKILNEGVNTVIHTAAKVGGVNANMNNNQSFFKDNYVINSNVIKVCSILKVENFVNILSTCIFPHENITYPLTSEQIDNGAPHPSNYGYSYAKRLSGYLEENSSVYPLWASGNTKAQDLASQYPVYSTGFYLGSTRRNNEYRKLWPYCKDC